MNSENDNDNGDAESQPPSPAQAPLNITRRWTQAQIETLRRLFKEGHREACIHATMRFEHGRTRLDVVAKKRKLGLGRGNTGTRISNHNKCCSMGTKEWTAKQSQRRKKVQERRVQGSAKNIAANQSHDAGPAQQGGQSDTSYHSHNQTDPGSGAPPPLPNAFGAQELRDASGLQNSTPNTSNSIESLAEPSLSDYEQYLSNGLPPLVQHDLERQVRVELGFAENGPQAQRVVNMMQQWQLGLIEQFKRERRDGRGIMQRSQDQQVLQVQGEPEQQNVLANETPTRATFAAEPPNMTSAPPIGQFHAPNPLNQPGEQGGHNVEPQTVDPRNLLWW